MRIAHIADIHAGKRLHGHDLAPDLAHVLHGVAEACVAEQVQALLIAGDLYDSRQPSPAAVSTVSRFFSELAAAGIETVCIPGNHDSAEHVSYASGPLAEQGIHVIGAYTQAVEPVLLEDEHGPVAVWPMPFVRPPEVRRALGVDVASYTEALAAAVSAMPLEPGARNVLLAHQFVTDGGVGPERSESEVVVGGLDNVDARIFDGFEYVALGHLHRPQRVRSERMRYAGSPLKYSTSEAGTPKTMPIVDIGPKPTDGLAPIATRLVPLEPLHDLRVVTGPLDELVSDEVVSAANAEDYVYAQLTDQTPLLGPMAALRDAYPNVLGFCYLGSETAASSQLSEAAPSEDRGRDELFCDFFRAQTGAEITEPQLALLRSVLDDLSREA